MLVSRQFNKKYLCNWISDQAAKKTKIKWSSDTWSRPQKALLIAAIFSANALTVGKGQPSEL